MKALFLSPGLSLLLLLLLGKGALAQHQVPFTSDRWQFASPGYVLADFQGKPSVQLKNNTARLKDANFQDGIITFDLALAQGRGFTGVLLRMQDEQNYENFYIRPHQSGNPDATQYQPVFGGKEAWQLYGGAGYNAPVSYGFEEWMPVKLVLSGGQLEVYVRDLDKPALFVPHLKRPVQAGDLALSAFGEGARFANFTYTPLPAPAIKSTSPPQAPTPAGTILQWQVSGAFPENRLDKSVWLSPAQKNGISWRQMTAEETGMLNLATGPAWSKAENTAFARVVIESDRDQIKPLQLGFSDRARVYLNDQLLYAGHDEFLSRDYRFLGTVGYYDEVYLALKKGQNELWIAVADDFGGWGLKAALPDQAGVKILQPKRD